MPTILIKTNIEDEKLPKGFEETVSRRVTEILGTHPERMIVSIDTDQRMSKNLKTEPMCLVFVLSVSAVGKLQNDKYTDQLISFFAESLGLQIERITIVYQPVDPNCLGYYLDKI